MALRPELLAFAGSLSLDRDLAEDLVQDAIARALNSDTAPRKTMDLRPWMFRVIKNLFLDKKRKDRIRREFSNAQGRLFDAGLTEDRDPLESLMVRQAFAKLSTKDREILCLVDVLGLTYAEAAAVIDIPLGTVMSRVSRARRAMIERLGETNIHPLRIREG
ncbi:MAG TPA: RNA polymerase sigma factor [Thermohalobaculum sp.]|nr:RNA polymerase sigma factor [Thermohalobaculum sp.]